MGTYILEWLPNGVMKWFIRLNEGTADEREVMFASADASSGEVGVPGAEGYAAEGFSTEQFDHPFYLLLNVAVGGNSFDRVQNKPYDTRSPESAEGQCLLGWANDGCVGGFNNWYPFVELGENAELKVDYVRVYSLEGITKDVWHKAPVMMATDTASASPAVEDSTRRNLMASHEFTSIDEITGNSFLYSPFLNNFSVFMLMCFSYVTVVIGALIMIRKRLGHSSTAVLTAGNQADYALLLSECDATKKQSLLMNSSV